MGNLYVDAVLPADKDEFKLAGRSVYGLFDWLIDKVDLLELAEVWAVCRLSINDAYDSLLLTGTPTELLANWSDNWTTWVPSFDVKAVFTAF